MSWRIELSRPAVDALRALPRPEQARVARRIEEVAEAGLPPALAGRREAAPVPAGEQHLLCLEEPGERRITVVAIRRDEAPAGEAVRAMVARRMGRIMGGEGRMGRWIQDLGYALRSLRSAPDFTLTAIFTLALGIGATAAIFSVAHGVLLQPLPYDDPDQVVTIQAVWDNYPDGTWVAEDEFRLWHQENRTLEDAALYYRGSAVFTDVENPERVGAALVTPNLFSVLGVEPVVGRTFTWEEARLPDPPLLLSWEAWQRRYGGDPDVVGRTVEVDGALTPILGVLPQGFALPVDYGLSTPTDLFGPVFVDLESPAPELGTGGSHGAYVVGRLREGVGAAEADADLKRIQAQVPAVGLYGPERGFTVRVDDAKDRIVGSARGRLGLLLGTVAFVLLIACGNVANLLLSRAERRSREMAVRNALGAGRGRLVRQLLLESALLAGVAGVLGLAVAAVGVPALLAIDPDAVPRSASVSLNGTVVALTLGTALLTALLFGAAPAVRVARGDAAGVLREEGRARGRGPGSNRTQGLLVAGQMAMAVILLTSAALMGRTFVQLLGVDPGFRPAEDVLTLRLTVPEATYPEPGDVVGFYDALLRRVREVPGVRRAGAARLLPLASTMGDAGFRVDGYEPAPNEALQAEWQWATPGYMEVLGIPLVAGRTFGERDGADAADVVIISQSMADRYFQGREAVGSRMLAYWDTVTVVGVVGNVAHNGITAPRKHRFYRPHAQVDVAGPSRSLTLTVETDGDPYALLEPVRAEVRALDPTIPVAQVRSMDEVLAGAVAEQRFSLVLLGVFAAIALTLSLVGIYGVLSYAVSRRTREIGVRLALGAERGRVIGLVVRRGMAMALLGVLVGTLVALALSGFMEGMLYQVAPRDTVTFVGVPLLFALVALAACFVPALRAARVDPARALRYE
jgi:putative ABC transport system permease protein